MLNPTKIEPDCFTLFKKKNKPKTYERDCDHKVRECLRNTLFEEQKEQCFYCEQKIKNDSKKVHIEHFIPRDANLKDTDCNYNNLFLSCEEKEHCGKKKDNKYDENKYIRLFSNKYSLENPSDFFDYSTRGKIKAKNSLSDDKKIRAENTIELLNLNYKELVNARKVMFKNIESYQQSGLDIKTIYSYFKEFESIFKKFGEL